MKLFAKPKPTQDDLDRQAADELEAALGQAKPPTEAERTWVLPLTDVPDLRPTSGS